MRCSDVAIRNRVFGISLIVQRMRVQLSTTDCELAPGRNSIWSDSSPRPRRESTPGFASACIYWISRQTTTQQHTHKDALSPRQTTGSTIISDYELKPLTVQIGARGSSDRAWVLHCTQTGWRTSRNTIVNNSAVDIP